MLNILKKYLYILLFTIPFIVMFSTFYINGFCLADPVLSESALENFQVLNGGMGAANYYGLNAQGYDPFTLFIVGAGGDVLDKTNTWLENNTDYDLSDMGFMANDMIETASWNEGTADGMINRLTKGAYQSLGSAVQNGVNFLASKVMVGGMAAKMFITGAIDSATNTISSIYGNNAYIKLTDTYVNNINDSLTNYLQNYSIPNISTLNYKFGKNVEFTSTSEHKHYVLKFDKPLLFYNDVANGQIYFIRPSGYEINSFSGVIVNTTNGQSASFSSYGTASGPNNFVINNVTYITKAIRINSKAVYSDIFYNGLDSCKSFISTYNPFNFSQYSFNYSDNLFIKNLFDQLKDKWVTTDDLKQINDKLGELTLGNISINGQNNNVIDTDSDSLSGLADLIQSIIDNNAFLNNDTNFDSESSLTTEPVPEPDPDNEINFGGTTLPEDFVPFGWTPLFDTIKLPFEFSGLFQPLFYVFGSFAGLWAIWSFVPIAILVLLFIWALK